MKPKDFTLSPKESHLFDTYKFNDSLDTPIGSFQIEIRTDDGSPPDDMMYAFASELKEEFEDDVCSVIEMIYGSYKKAEKHEGWMKECDTPIGLKIEELAPYLEGRTLTVERCIDDEEEPYPKRVYVSPRWDTDHGIYLKKEKEKWIQTEF